MKRAPNWTPRQDAVAAAMLAEGELLLHVAERLGRTVEAVRRRRNWIKHSAEKRAEIGRTKTRNRYLEIRA